MKKRLLALTFLLPLGGGVIAGCGGGNTGTPDMAPACPTGGVTFTDIKASVFKVSCAFGSSCHGAGSTMGGLDLVTDPYKALVNADSAWPQAKTEGLKRVAPGDTAHSFTWIKVNLPSVNDPKYGTRMPQTGQKLDASQLQKLQCWIEAGALNN